MFCFQCEQTAAGKGCSKVGVCGKQPETAVLQDLIIFQLKGISLYAYELRKIGIKSIEADRFAVEALFTTITNVDFDNNRLESIIRKGDEIKKSLKKQYLSNSKKEIDNPAAKWEAQGSLQDLIKFAETIGVQSNVLQTESEDTNSLKQIVTYGLKGLAAYADHALVLGFEEDSVYEFIHSALSELTQKKEVNELIGLVLKTGEVNLKVMELLDKANTETFGHPEPTPVFTGVKKGPAILVSGHDLLDLYELLQQTEGKGINVYTHGEMLPALAYPKLKKFKHLIGNYGSAWQNQTKEFDEFAGSILMTTNCIQKPKDSYKDRIFTTGLVAFPGVKHIENRKSGSQKDFSSLIKKAIEIGGFKEEQNGPSAMTGFARNAVLSVADKIIDAVKGGAIKHFFLVGGCDGAKPGRNYYTEFVEKTPKDTVVLTLACGKFRFNKIDIGKIGPFPRLLDMGQCNDAYSAIKVAVALAEAFKCGVNELPLSLVLSWYEQKAVCILLTLLYLGIKDIRLGPSLPAFVSPNVLKVLVDNFNIKPVSTPDEDLKAILGA
ncbi:hydroxylamine reductase [Candidatus Dependentiae bacterium]|nr:hydroxylamine reductase [Candidatus Dependentiae bacterium]